MGLPFGHSISLKFINVYVCIFYTVIHANLNVNVFMLNASCSTLKQVYNTDSIGENWKNIRQDIVSSTKTKQQRDKKLLTNFNSVVTV